MCASHSRTHAVKRGHPKGRAEQIHAHALQINSIYLVDSHERFNFYQFIAIFKRHTAKSIFVLFSAAALYHHQHWASVFANTLLLSNNLMLID